jgi:hypothetical protein
MQNTVQGEVVDIGGLPGEQGGVFDPPDRAADERPGGKDYGGRFDVSGGHRTTAL